MHFSVTVCPCKPRAPQKWRYDRCRRLSRWRKMSFQPLERQLLLSFRKTMTVWIEVAREIPASALPPIHLPEETPDAFHAFPWKEAILRAIQKQQRTWSDGGEKFVLIGQLENAG